MIIDNYFKIKSLLKLSGALKVKRTNKNEYIK